MNLKKQKLPHVASFSQRTVSSQAEPQEPEACPWLALEPVISDGWHHLCITLASGFLSQLDTLRDFGGAGRKEVAPGLPYEIHSIKCPFDHLHVEPHSTGASEKAGSNHVACQASKP